MWETIIYFIAQLIRLLSLFSRAMRKFFDRLTGFLHELLLVLFSPRQISSLVQDSYQSVYSPTWQTTAALDWKEDCFLHPIESELLDRYHVNDGTVLVLGCGWGREAIAIARRGVTVVGVDTNVGALRRAQELAKEAGVSAHFHQADLLDLPYARSAFDCAVLFGLMYSAIPSRSLRHAWLADLGKLLKPNSRVLLAFLPNREGPTRLRRVCTWINLKLMKLPGTNTAYQPGDDWMAGHFIHWFQDQDEIRKELEGAGMTVLEINWANGMAVVAYPPSVPTGTVS